MNTSQLLASDHYIDVLGLEAYEGHAGVELEVSELITGSSPEVFDAWLREVWLAGGDQVHKGVGRGYVGSVRRVPLGVEEEIVSAGQPEEQSKDQGERCRIPSICYRVRKPGPFPLESHLAMVRFVGAVSIPEVSANSLNKAPKTLVVWTVKTEMSRACNWLHCGGWSASSSGQR